MTDKIDPGFLDRLNAMPPDTLIRVILILHDENEYEEPKTRRTEQERKKIMESVLKSGKKAMNDINSILQSYGGMPLTSSPNVLGCISVETTGAGVMALASLDKVKAVMEDQPVFLNR